MKGKVAFVTGACRGIGRAIALELAYQGADVVVADILPEVGDTCDRIRDMCRRSVAAVAVEPDHSSSSLSSMKTVAD